MLLKLDSDFSVVHLTLYFSVHIKCINRVQMMMMIDFITFYIRTRRY